MNSGPNLVSLLIIGGVAGVSVFGLYLGYKAIFDKLENDSDLDDDSKNKLKRNLSEILSKIPETKLDVEKTLKRHKNTSDSFPKGEKTKKRGDVNIDTNIKKSDEVVSKPLAPRNSVNKLVIVNNDKLPVIMNKKRLTTSNEEIETLMEIPNINGSAIHAEALMDNETIRTIDKINLKKKKRTKKKSKNK
jgi:hypothetical protein